MADPLVVQLVESPSRVENAINPKKPSDLSDLVDRDLGCSGRSSNGGWLSQLILLGC
jgi:hypothetical protein